jgi:hypothetical protein
MPISLRYSSYFRLMLNLLERRKRSDKLRLLFRRVESLSAGHSSETPSYYGSGSNIYGARILGHNKHLPAVL